MTAVHAFSVEQFLSQPLTVSTAANVPVAIPDGNFGSIRVLAAAVDARDPWTMGHSDRVATYAAELAQALGLPGDDVDLIYRSGTLHDVGKIAVPDGILQKPEPLSEDEIWVMRSHAVLGEQIVSLIPQLGELLGGIRHHHERWDGLGYPDRLEGRRIPKVARYLAIADTYDAMTSDRPYRRGMERETALRALLEGAGTQFDPELVPAFVALQRGRRLVA
jgi:putative nucleotidyltransferase with HDIG domain